MTDPCTTCAARRTIERQVQIDGEPHWMFLCARRGWLVDAGGCADHITDLSLDPRIIEGGTLIVTSGAAAMNALRRGEKVAIDDVWYQVVNGRLCTLSPRGDDPIRAREDWTPLTLEGHVCVVIDHDGEAVE